MSTKEIKKQLNRIYTLLQLNKKIDAKQVFMEMGIIDTKDHLRLSYTMRHLIWNLHEFLILDNEEYTSQKEIMADLEIISKSKRNNY